MADFHKIDLNLLRVFQVILEERSLTRAGQQLGLSQPAVSYSLGRLRALFDDPLFIRTPDGMLPTPKAEQLAAPLGNAIASIRETLRHLERFDAATSSREFRLSMSDVGIQTFLPSICEKVQQLAPLMRIAAERVPLPEIEEKLRLGQLDFAIGNISALKPVMNSALLFHDEYACMTRKRPGLPARKLSQQKFMEFSHVAVTSTDSSYVEIDESLRASGLHRRIALRVPHFTVIPQILQRTDWMVTLPRGVAYLLNESGQFQIYPLPVELPHIASTVYWHSTFDNDEGNRWFRQLLVETLRPH
ncbi:LysR family transcriptional regulator [Paraburkholderia ginsengiterrae]|uniref:LysR family transcriptional regulator n=1 Tax=Paraburkholderia ginsengiterrae TaxID=1462993 RepID=A0A1A9N8Q9_9BURK|nr:LysR family transcriptional regulator [Paraburkholderia ginsengiterrae]OAJ54798.1 LysR family transcriptional regulator [Paraburkholderia ginsengiterrae]OAJ60984.1 LysR family transcriptional regulator [Paraburkholderia ginsengiterrae]